MPWPLSGVAPPRRKSALSPTQPAPWEQMALDEGDSDDALIEESDRARACPQPGFGFFFAAPDAHRLPACCPADRSAREGWCGRSTSKRVGVPGASSLSPKIPPSELVESEPPEEEG